LQTPESLPLHFYPPRHADSEQVVTAMLNQNFVPIVDGRNALCGILTRKRLIEFLAQARDKKE
jgi:predicted transcriptional regulator